MWKYFWKSCAESDTFNFANRMSSAARHPSSPIRRCALASLGVLALSFVIATETARGQGIPDSPATDIAQASEQQATTGQAASTSADAMDAQPTNILVSLRINSPGDNGPVSQTSTTAVAGDAANDAATAQDGWQDWDSDHQAGEGQPQAAR